MPATSTYLYLEPEDPSRRPHTIEGHLVQDGAHSWLFHLGPPVIALGEYPGADEWGVTEGWNCYHTVDGPDERGYHSDAAETLVDVNVRRPRMVQ